MLAPLLNYELRLGADRTSHDPSLVEEALTQSLHDLGLAYLDLWLMHWPVGNAPDTGKTQLDYLQVRAPDAALLPMLT